MIVGYLDLEIDSIDAFMDNIMGSTESLVIDIDRAMEGLMRLAEVECEDDPDPELEERPELQGANDSRRSPTIKGEQDAGSTSSPPTPSKTQVPATTEDSKAGEPQLVEIPPQGADRGIQADT